MLTDWGLAIRTPAICHGVVLDIVPEALIVDITHEIDKYNIRHGALMLWRACPILPIGAHMAVVDPGVGTAAPAHRDRDSTRRLRSSVRTTDCCIPGAERLGGIMRVHVIDNVQYRLPVLTSTFHGRDLFAPAAAHLALGVPLQEFGPQIDPSELVAIDWPPRRRARRRARVDRHLPDSFGNLKLAGVTADLLDAIEGLEHGDELEVRLGGRNQAEIMPWAPTFGDVAPWVLPDLRGFVRPAVRRPEPGQCRGVTGGSGGNDDHACDGARRRSPRRRRQARGVRRLRSARSQEPASAAVRRVQARSAQRRDRPRRPWRCDRGPARLAA